MSSPLCLGCDGKLGYMTGREFIGVPTPPYREWPERFCKLCGYAKPDMDLKGRAHFTNPNDKKEPKAMQLFHTAVLLHPTEEEKEKGASTRVLVEHRVLLAPNIDTAKTLVGRDIPEDEIGKADRIEVCVSPF